MIEKLFWILFIVVSYTFIGYAVLLWFLVRVKRVFVKKEEAHDANTDLPHVCLFVTAYNEKDFVAAKVKNSFQLNYPKDKIQYLWLTDGSDDGTPDLLKEYPEIQVKHLPERKGKVHAMNRGVKFVDRQIIIFSDCNTILNRDSILEIVRQFEDPKVGCVAGEKRIIDQKDDNAAASGESLYWRFESCIKKMDAELNSSVGAAGELFAVRRELYEEIESDTILDDFIISLRIAQKGYKIAYAPNAYASETASANVTEELKRKIRIAAGGVQSIFRVPGLLNPFRFGCLSFQYFSHKVLRWTIAPFSLFGLVIVNFLILLQKNNLAAFSFYSLFFYIQVLLYFIAFCGWLIGNRKIRSKFLFVPYYFVVMNYASIAGVFRFFIGKQKVTWDKSRRA